MYRKFITALPLIVSLCILANAGVTNIKEIVNNTAGAVTIKPWEHAAIPGNGNVLMPKRIPPHGVWTGDLWIPWADNAEQFRYENIMIEVKIPSGSQPDSITNFCFWQSGEYVRYNDKTVFVENAPRVAGLSKVNGERRLVISEKNKKAVFTFEEYKK